MALFDDLWDSAVEHGTAGEFDEETEREFRDTLADLYNDAGLDDFDDIPSADEIPKDQWGDWIEFFDDYGLWDDVREEWERYEVTA